MSSKLSSRKLWVCIGIALTGIGSTIAGIVTGVTIPNETLSLVLTIAGMALTGIGGVAYEIAEAVVDSARAEADSKETITQVSATSSSKETVDAVLIPKAQPGEPPEEATSPGGTA